MLEFLIKLYRIEKILKSIITIKMVKNTSSISLKLEIYFLRNKIAKVTNQSFTYVMNMHWGSLVYLFKTYHHT